MSLTLSPESQSAAESAFVAAFCPRSGQLLRRARRPNGGGGVTSFPEETRSVKFGVVKRESVSSEEGERVASITTAKLKVGKTEDVKLLDIITDEETGERWEVRDAPVPRQFLTELPCVLLRGA